MITLINSNSLNIPLANRSVQCVVTSPPYWGLRDYGVSNQLGLERAPDCLGWATGHPCGECYICHMVAVFREVKRVLRDDGTCWLNMGDSYAADQKGGIKNHPGDKSYTNRGGCGLSRTKPIHGLKPKDLCGIPWRLALALQADGWYLRSDIIWHKPNPMPESVTDRPTKAHEYVFLLTKSQRYYYDQEAVRDVYTEPMNRWGGESLKRDTHKIAAFKEMKRVGSTSAFRVGRNMRPIGSGRNKRTVWTIPTKPYSGAHFATFPPALVESCILAGTSEKGCCPKCGKPWRRMVKKGYRAPAQEDVIAEMIAKGVPRQKANLYGNPTRAPQLYIDNPDVTIGWQPGCKCNAGDPIPCIVFDPFVGSGTTLEVARQLGRSGIGCDLSWDYLHDQARKRLMLDKLNKWSGNAY